MSSQQKKGGGLDKRKGKDVPEMEDEARLNRDLDDEHRTRDLKANKAYAKSTAEANKRGLEQKWSGSRRAEMNAPRGRGESMTGYPSSSTPPGAPAGWRPSVAAYADTVGQGTIDAYAHVEKTGEIFAERAATPEKLPATPSSKTSLAAARAKTPGQTPRSREFRGIITYDDWHRMTKNTNEVIPNKSPYDNPVLAREAIANDMKIHGSNKRPSRPWNEPSDDEGADPSPSTKRQNTGGPSGSGRKIDAAQGSDMKGEAVRRPIFQKKKK